MEIESGVDFELWLLGTGGLADVEGAAVLSAERCGDTVLALEDTTQSGPTGVLSVFGEAPADGLDQLVGDDGDEEVTVGTVLGFVEDGAEAEFGLERAEHGFEISEHGVSAPQGLWIPVVDIGTEQRGRENAREYQ